MFFSCLTFFAYLMLLNSIYFKIIKQYAFHKAKTEKRTVHSSIYIILPLQSWQPYLYRRTDRQTDGQIDRQKDKFYVKEIKSCHRQLFLKSTFCLNLSFDHKYSCIYTFYQSIGGGGQVRVSDTDHVHNLPSQRLEELRRSTQSAVGFLEALYIW